ncbi:uncharacterized protein LOC128259564 [Drosophila gunungcola]|uniref:uncharacterized protein LOC128259564 n=1 Tax=Drosophila gunungcola TaxID=103775 RepID=UPI0022E31B75|nr:uncharacterized protein LOC128259564 [Drosophila gunungcola]
MDPLRRNPILAVIKCEMCPNRVYHFVTGLCARCLTIWCGKRQPDGMRFSLDQTRSVIVSMVRGPQDLSQMDPVFKQAIDEVRLQRLQKVELFQKLRHQFQLGVLHTPFHDPQPQFVTEEGYWNVPEIADSDLQMFQNEVDLLSDVPRQSLADLDKNNNEFDYFND